MTNTDKVKHIRGITFSPVGKINKALAEVNGDVEKAIALLIANRDADATDIANRKADNNVVFSYVHNHRVGAMIVVACQTDFVAKNEKFLELAKDICMHIVSTPKPPEAIDEASINKEFIESWRNIYLSQVDPNKPEAVKKKIVEGKINKLFSEACLLNQKFVKNEDITVKDLISSVSAIVGEKIEVKKFVRLSA
jgi:elongation factor Ts